LLIIFGDKITAGMKREIEAAREACIPVFNFDTEYGGKIARETS